ncbi:MFS transporter [Rubrobacter marinus]|uniref:MFS transporter n=1 Tax=Rubrobacter marinus TaxID=2653852 RepID=A0A6G8PYF1_9ACTN|nr:MFS transporter [Rubrobacter marinus]QIN79252.1 MFS transporter [Rubrobacter marinus]
MFGLGAEYGKLWTASTVSNLGDGVTLVAAPLLAASLTRDPVLVSGVVFAGRLPWLLFSLPSGALVDRLDRRLVMGLVDGLRAAVVGALGLAVLLGWASIPLLYAVFFLLGVAETLFDNASTAILPAMVPKEGLERANGQLIAAQMVTNEAAGPLLGGALFAFAASAPFLLDAGTFAVSAALVLALRGSFRVEWRGGDSPTTLYDEIGEGLGWLVRHRLLLTLALMLGASGFALVGTFSVLVLYAQDVLGLGEFGYGALLSASVFGGVAGSLLAGKVGRLMGTGRAIFGIFVLGVVVHAGLALATNPYLAGAMLALEAFHAMVWNVLTISLRQALIPNGLLGRVGSAFRMIGLGGQALGALAGGVLARAYGITAPFWLAVMIYAALAALALGLLSNRAVSEARSAAEI